MSLFTIIWIVYNEPAYVQFLISLPRLRFHWTDESYTIHKPISRLFHVTDPPKIYTKVKTPKIYTQEENTTDYIQNLHHTTPQQPTR